MTTQQVADQLVAFCRQGQYLEAIDALYAPDIVSHEMPGFPDSPTHGFADVRAKTEQFNEKVVELHAASCSDPLVAGNHFAVTMGLDLTTKEQPRHQVEEVCVYEVKDGKIVREQFFYDMPQ